MKNLANSVMNKGPAAQDEKCATAPKSKIDSVTIIYVPIYFGGRHRGTSMGPAAMRVANLTETIQGMGLKVANEVDIPVPHSSCWLDHREGPRCVPEIRAISEEVAAAVEAAMDANTVPITIGGDHSLAIGSIAGVSSYYRKKNQVFGLTWFDAHGDINTPETTDSGNVHGMPLAVSLGRGDSELINLLGFCPKVDARRSALIGIRDIDAGERVIINETGITPFTIRDIDHLGLGRVTDLALGAVGADVNGIHLSFDIDVMDPDIAPGTTCHAQGGLDYREVTLALTLLAETGLLKSIDMVELNPAFDVRNKTADLCVDLITTCLGKRIL